MNNGHKSSSESVVRSYKNKKKLRVSNKELKGQAVTNLAKSQL